MSDPGIFRRGLRHRLVAQLRLLYDRRDPGAYLPENQEEWLVDADAVLDTINLVATDVQAIIDQDSRLAGMDPEQLRLARALAAHPSCLGCGAAGDGGPTYCASHGDWLCEECADSIRAMGRLREAVQPIISRLVHWPKGHVNKGWNTEREVHSEWCPPCNLRAALQANSPDDPLPTLDALGSKP